MEKGVEEGAVGEDSAPSGGRRRGERKQILLRLDPAVHEALAKWANDELRSVNAHIEFVLRRALREQGRAPKDAAPMRKRGRPRKQM
ncbi:Uncharacterised protein [Dermatophilus congolensis]|uniref:Toxin-antitoxin system HicB family antitoxin n=1 Tax=Dermatophilus congolensis TaxID=1863 RepID=A0A239VHS4_9MICO|nr:Uncharacterised protein [Dermatophilus congolensis]